MLYWEDLIKVCWFVWFWFFFKAYSISTACAYFLGLPGLGEKDAE